MSRDFTLSILSFFFNDTATTEIYTLSLHDALPIYFTNTITMKRVWKDEGKYESFQETNSMIDVILSYIARMDNVPSLQLIDNAKTLDS